MEYIITYIWDGIRGALVALLLAALWMRLAVSDPAWFFPKQHLALMEIHWCT